MQRLWLGVMVCNLSIWVARPEPLGKHSDRAQRALGAKTDSTGTTERCCEGLDQPLQLDHDLRVTVTFRDCNLIVGQRSVFVRRSDWVYQILDHDQSSWPPCMLKVACCKPSICIKLANVPCPEENLPAIGGWSEPSQTSWKVGGFQGARKVSG